MRAVSCKAWIPVLAMGFVIVGCESPSAPDPLAAVATVTVSQAADTVLVGESIQLTAEVINGYGDTLSTPVSWSSSNSEVATVSSGMVTGVSDGPATITATAEQVSGTATITVIDLRPDPPSNVLAEAVSHTRVAVSWNDESDDETAFRIERELAASSASDLSSSAAFIQVGEVGPDETSFLDTNLVPGTTYRYRVLGCNAFGCSTSDSSPDVSTHDRLEVVSAELPSGVAGSAFSLQLEATGAAGEYTWGLESGSLPDGLDLSDSGLITGVPESVGSWQFTVRVEAVFQNAVKLLALSVFEPVFIDTPLPEGSVGLPYAGQLTATGGDGEYQWLEVVNGLPAGLELEASGLVSGTPSEGGDFELLVRVNSGDGQDVVAPVSLRIHPAVSITTAGLPRASLGAGYDQVVQATGGNGVYTWDVAGGVLPDGVSLDADGRLSGIPTEFGVFDFSARVTSGDGQVLTRDLSLEVATDLFDMTALVPIAYIGEAYSTQLVADGGNGRDYVWTLKVGNLPPGLTLQPDGVISGIPIGPGIHEFQVSASSAGREATTALTMTISSAPSSGFNISIQNVSPEAAAPPSAEGDGSSAPTPIHTNLRTALGWALQRWEAIIIGDLPGVTFPAQVAAEDCFGAGDRLSGFETDDLVLFLSVESIDGVGGSLGGAAFCFFRSANGLPAAGFITIDKADVLARDPVLLRETVFHQIGHALGFGETLWSQFGLLQGGGGADPRYTGAGALVGYEAAGGFLATIPVENGGGAGIRDNHWEEGSFGPEIMTGFDMGVSQPISLMTIGSMMDLGYVVDTSQADPFGCPSFCLVEPASNEGREAVYDVVLPGNKYGLDKDGRVVVVLAEDG